MDAARCYNLRRSAKTYNKLIKFAINQAAAIVVTAKQHKQQQEAERSSN